MKNLIKIAFPIVMLTNTSFGWTNNHTWETGDEIVWNVPYQSQESFRNWTSACMSTSGAMLVNFLYQGATIEKFTDIKGKLHPWLGHKIINNSYATTGQRMYAQGIITNNEADLKLKEYLKKYPKSGINQSYNNAINDRYGPINNERLHLHSGYTYTNINNGSAQGQNTNLISYLEKKHSLLPSINWSKTTQSIRNQLYNGPIIMSKGGHVFIIIGVNSDGNFIVNDPWGASLKENPTTNGGNHKEYIVTDNQLSAYRQNYTVSYTIYTNVMEEYKTFSPYSIPVEANVKFKYDGSANWNDNYDGDGDYANIRNGFTVDNSNDDLFYRYGSINGYLYTKSKTDKDTNTVRWTPQIIKNGKYEVLVGFVDRKLSENSSDVKYTIYHANGDKTVSINQSTSSNSSFVKNNIIYKSLGKYDFKKGTEGSVRLTNLSSDENKVINIDIIKFQYLPDLCKKYSGIPLVNEHGKVHIWDNTYFRLQNCKSSINNNEFAVFFDENDINDYAVSDDYWQKYINNDFGINSLGRPTSNISSDNAKCQSFEKALLYKKNNMINTLYGNNLSCKSYQNYTKYVNNSKDFSDISQSPYKLYIDDIKYRRIVDGYKKGTFKPTKLINRAEFLKIVLLAKYNIVNVVLELLYSNQNRNQLFTDVQYGQWFAPYVYFATKKNIIKGYSDGKFHPENNITFAEASKILVKVLIDSNIKEIENSPNWYLPFVKKLQEMKIKTFAHNHKLTRAEMAYLVSSILNLKDK